MESDYALGFLLGLELGIAGTTVVFQHSTSPPLELVLLG